MSLDIRWQQRFLNYRKALSKLTQAIQVVDDKHLRNNNETKFDSVDELLIEGLIQRFEYTHELAWKVMKDFAKDQGSTLVTGSKDATREAFQMGLIEDLKPWLEMIPSRNATSHDYDQHVMFEIFEKIIDTYYPLFQSFEKAMILQLQREN